MGPIYPHVACWRTERVRVRGFSLFLITPFSLVRLFSVVVVVMLLLRRSFEMNDFWAHGCPGLPARVA